MDIRDRAAYDNIVNPAPGKDDPVGFSGFCGKTGLEILDVFPGSEVFEKPALQIAGKKQIGKCHVADFFDSVAEHRSYLVVSKTDGKLVFVKEDNAEQGIFKNAPVPGLRDPDYVRK